MPKQWREESELRGDCGWLRISWEEHEKRANLQTLLCSFTSVFEFAGRRFLLARLQTATNDGSHNSCWRFRALSSINASYASCSKSLEQPCLNKQQGTQSSITATSYECPGMTTLMLKTSGGVTALSRVSRIRTCWWSPIQCYSQQYYLNINVSPRLIGWSPKTH